MKKIQILLAFIFTALSAGAFAQGFYLRLGMGYAMPQAGQTIDGTGQPYNGTQNNPSASQQTYNLKGASFSAGLQGTVGLGYMFGPHVGVQLDAGIGLSTHKITYNDNNVVLDSILSNVSVVQQAKAPIIMMPALVLQSGGKTWNLYTRFGPALPLKTTITQDQILVNAPGTGALELEDFTFKIKNSFSVGIAAAAGVQYRLSDRVSLWGEVSLLSLSCYIKESDLTAVTVNGQSYSLSSVTGPQTVTYSKKASVDSTGATAAAYSQPFSNVGINIGVTFNLSRNTGRSNSSSHNDDIDDNKPFRRR